MIDVIAMPFGFWNIKYLVLARKELSNLIEGKALKTKSIERIYWFILKDIQYKSIGRIRVDKRKLDAIKASKFFKKYKV